MLIVKSVTRYKRRWLLELTMNKHVRALLRLLTVLFTALFLIGTPFMINDWIMSLLPPDKASQLIQHGFDMNVTVIYWIGFLSLTVLTITGLIKLKEFCYKD